MDADHPPARKLFTFASGGWLALAASVVTLGIIVWAVGGALLRPGGRLLGDGKDPATYGFDLATTLVPRERIVAGGMRKDALRALVNPPVVTAKHVAALGGRHKYLVSSDRVIGVEIGGSARAYPLSIMNGHEIVNDTLGGVPIAVTYNPLCDSVLVFDRRLGGETLELGVSGLLYNSNMLMFDRRPETHRESLWSQLQARAIAGPAAERRAELVQLPATLETWAAWHGRHPDSTVVDRDPARLKLYKRWRASYRQYFIEGTLRFEVDPLPPPDGLELMDRVVAVRAGHQRAVYGCDRLLERAGGTGTWPAVISGHPYRFDVVEGDPVTVRVTRADTGEPAIATYALWFAWHAMFPEDALRN